MKVTEVVRLARILRLCEGSRLAGSCVCDTTSGASIDLFFGEGDVAIRVTVHCAAVSSVEARELVSLERAVEVLGGDR